MLNKIIEESKIQKAKKIIDKVDKIVIVSHASPDGDALGSSLALYHYFMEIGKLVNVIMPNDFPGFLRWLPGSKDIVVARWHEDLAKELIDAADLIFCLDFNDLSRIDLNRTPMLSACVAQSAAKKIMIDHHPYPEEFCDVTISHPEISSTSELIFRFICRMGMFEFIDKKGAECIYTGMMTDTGAFTFNSNQSAIYYIISELIEKGIDKDEIYAKVYNRSSELRLRLKGFVLYEKMEIISEYKTALIVLSDEEQKRFEVKKGDMEGFVNMPLSIDEVVMSVFIREDENAIRISFRSKDQVPCNTIANDVFGGGGHLNAAGGEYYGKLEDAVRMFRKALPHYQKHIVNS